MSWAECFSQKHFAFRISLSNLFLHRPLHRLHAFYCGTLRGMKIQVCFWLSHHDLEYKSPCSALKTLSWWLFCTIKKNSAFGPQNQPTHWGSTPYTVPVKTTVLNDNTAMYLYLGISMCTHLYICIHT